MESTHITSPNLLGVVSFIVWMSVIFGALVYRCLNISNPTNQWLQRFQCQFIIIQTQVLLLLVGLETQFKVH